MILYYAVLGVNRDASVEEINEAFKTKKLEAESDQPSKVDAKDIQVAWLLLSDKDKRQRYDRLLDLVMAGKGNEKEINVARATFQEDLAWAEQVLKLNFNQTGSNIPMNQNTTEIIIKGNSTKNEQPNVDQSQGKEGFENLSWGKKVVYIVFSVIIFGILTSFALVNTKFGSRKWKEYKTLLKETQLCNQIVDLIDSNRPALTDHGLTEKFYILCRQFKNWPEKSGPFKEHIVKAIIDEMHLDVNFLAAKKIFVDPKNSNFRDSSLDPERDIKFLNFIKTQIESIIWSSKTISTKSTGEIKKGP